MKRVSSHTRLGLHENIAQFMLLVAVNGFVGAMVGMERTILPALAEQEFQVTGRTAMLSFIAVFGLTKAVTNYAAGRLADRVAGPGCLSRTRCWVSARVSPGR
jgi:hypothetical protein